LKVPLNLQNITFARDHFVQDRVKKAVPVPDSAKELLATLEKATPENKSK
jgi:hypothetical protein